MTSVDARGGGRRQAATSVQRLLDGEPVRRALGPVARDARAHVVVAGLARWRRRRAGAWRRAARATRVAALAAARAAQHEVGRVAIDRPGPPSRTGVVGGRPGRSPGSRIVLLPTPSRPGLRASGRPWVSSPITVTGSRRIRTAFPAPGGEGFARDGSRRPRALQRALATNALGLGGGAAPGVAEPRPRVRCPVAAGLHPGEQSAIAGRSERAARPQVPPHRPLPPAEPRATSGSGFAQRAMRRGSAREGGGESGGGGGVELAEDGDVGCASAGRPERR